ncbi:MAG: HD domain-containing protein [Candidatus Hydrothermarchaeaceae archaeon]
MTNKRDRELRESKVIRDPIHGDIFLTELEMRIVDSLEFQRLRRIKQLGMTYLVYPSANHTRFEHSLGAMHVASRVAERLQLPKDDAIKLRVAALLHDAGHGPLSHTSEELLERYMGQSHEEITMELINSSDLSAILRDEGLKPEEVSGLILGRGGRLGRLISSELDVDRMDFLVRDAHHTGVAYGIIDLDRLINTLIMHDDSVAITEGGLRAVEAMLVARFLMTPTVYLHHTSRIADAMFLRMMERAIDDGLIEYYKLYTMDDYDAMNLFRGAKGYAGEISTRLNTRRLFKRAHTGEWHEVKEEMRTKLLSLRENPARRKAIEAEMAANLDLDEGYVVFDIPPVPSPKELHTKVVKDGRGCDIWDLSPIVRMLEEAQKSQWSYAVYAPKEHLEEVARECRSVESYLG